jgi:hypothetical protein
MQGPVDVQFGGNKVPPGLQQKAPCDKHSPAHFPNEHSDWGELARRSILAAHVAEGFGGVVIVIPSTTACSQRAGRHWKKQTDNSTAIQRRLSMLRCAEPASSARY